MTPTDLEESDIDQRIQELFEERQRLDQLAQERSAGRIADEIGRLAKRHQRLIPYLLARFWRMNGAQALLEPRLGREIAIELIALLESEERARVVQPEFPQDEYDETVAWMSACAYDNLAKHTANEQGYNSDGMQACIADGIEVCRRTGKLACITCFREYATDVYAHSDDLDMALHFSQLARSLPADAPGAERRWVGARNESWVRLLQGRLDLAEEAAHKALELAPTYHSPLSSRLESVINLEVILLLAGKHEQFASVVGTANEAQSPPPGEDPSHEKRSDLRDALVACCRGDFAEAYRKLDHWDRWLSEQGCLDDWFEVRLRSVAARRMAGETERAEALARPLAERAEKARDWLTLRRLHWLLAVDRRCSPFPFVAVPNLGPFAESTVEPAEAAADSVAAPASEASADEPAPTPFQDLYERLLVQGREAADTATLEPIVDELLGISPEQVEHPLDAVRLLHLAWNLVSQGAESEALWNWARSLVERHPEDASALNWLAMIGDAFRSQEGEKFEELIPVREIAQLFRRSLDRDPTHAGNFARAGGYFLSQNDLGEAERCFARGFRLARDSSFLALRLAEVYERTERPRDALAVLDLCLREGSEDPEVAWNAVLTANSLKQYEPVLTYADRYEALQPNQLWVNYYRAVALLELNRPAEALAALDEEALRDAERGYCIESLRANAQGALGNSDACRAHAANALTTPLAAIEYLSFNGLVSISERLWAGVASLPLDDPIRRTVEERLLQAGLLPDEFFHQLRLRGDTVEELGIYRCTIEQPLDERWADFPGRLSGQENWTNYRMHWGVVAQGEEDAQARVLEWQQRCYPLPATVVEVELQSDGYTDRPGVIWQGFRGWHDPSEDQE